MEKVGLQVSSKLLIVIFATVCFLPVGLALHNNSTLDLYEEKQELQEDVVTGLAFGSSAVVSGKACLINSSKDLRKIENGDIVVTVMTHESWSPFLKKSAAIITDLGDSTCHAALFGKHNDIPVLVGAYNATEKIKDDQHVILDCSGVIGKSYIADGHDYTITQKKSVALVVTSTTTIHCDKPVDSGVVATEKAPVKKNIVTKQQMNEITQDLFNKHKDRFIKYVLGLQSRLSVRHWFGETSVVLGAQGMGYDPFAIECMKISYNLFDCSESYIRSLCAKPNLDMVNAIFHEAGHKVRDKNELARFSHKHHINRMVLPENISKESLIQHPAQYNQIVQQDKIDTQACHLLTISGLFAQYCVDSNIC